MRQRYVPPVPISCHWVLSHRQLERALGICKSGDVSTNGHQRRGKNSIHNFVAEPWAERAANYLPPIKALSLQKWSEIFSLGMKYRNPKGISDTDIFENSADSTDGDEASNGYLDPRSCIVISDDEPEDDDDDGSSPCPEFETTVIIIASSQTLR